MENLVRMAVENKRAIVFMALLLSLTGAYLLLQIPQGVFPEAEFPRIQVLVDFGLAPLSQMEAEIVKPVEEAVMLVPGVEAVRSATNRGSSEIDVFFDWHEDMFKAYQLLQAQVSGIQHVLPDGVALNIRRINTSTFPIASYSLYSDTRNLMELWDLANFTIRPQLAEIPGIFNIEIVGGDQREYRVALDPEKLAANQLDYRSVADALAETNTVDFVGRLNESHQLYLNVADNRYRNITEIGETVITDRFPTPVLLRDIAEILPAAQETFIKTRSNFHDAVLVNVLVQPGVNSVDVMRQVETRMTELRQNFPNGVELRKWYDLSDFIKNSIFDVYSSILEGAALTILILLLFLRRIRITLVTGLIIPVALLIAFIVMKLAGMDLNLMSLGGLAASIGILVDNAIVVVENIERYLEEGFPRTEAVVKATGEIIAPLIGATLTTLVVFIPLVFLSGVPGIFFGALAGTLAVTIAISMILAVFLTPAIADTLVSTRPKQSGKFLPKIIAAHQKVLEFNLKQPLFAFALVLVLGAVAVFSYLNIPSGFLPEWDEGTIVLDFVAPPGSSLEGSYAMLLTIENHLKEIPEVENYSLRIGTSLGHPRVHPNEGDFLISLKSDRQRSVYEIMDELRTFAAIAEPRLETELFQVLPDRLNSDLAGEVAPIAIKVWGNNLPLMQEVAQQLADSLETIANIEDVYRGYNPSEPELSIRVLPEAAARFGLSVKDINRAVRMALWGESPTHVLSGLKNIPLRLQYKKDRERYLADVQRLPLYFPQIQRVVNLDELAEIHKSPGLADVEHDNLSLIINVSGQISGRDLGSVARDVQQMLDRFPLPQGISTQLGGAYESQQNAFNELMLVLLAGAMMVFTILLFEFRSFRISIVIMMGTMLAVTGVFVMLWLTGIPFDISAFMGMIMIIGVVVNNGILVIDYAEYYLKEHRDLKLAVLTACRVRLRPVLMTSLSTITGFLPLALSQGQGSEMLRPLAVAMIGGISLSIILSLLLIPTLYFWVKNRSANFQMTPANG